MNSKESWMWNICQSSTRIVAWDDISTTAHFRAFALGLLYWILTQSKTEISEKHSKVCATRYLYGIRPTKVHTSPRILQPDLCPRRENLTWLHCNFRALHPLTLYNVLLAPWWQTAQMIASMQGSSNRKSQVLFFQATNQWTIKPPRSHPLLFFLPGRVLSSLSILNATSQQLRLKPILQLHTNITPFLGHVWFTNTTESSESCQDRKSQYKKKMNVKSGRRFQLKVTTNLVINKTATCLTPKNSLKSDWSSLIL